MGEYRKFCRPKTTKSPLIGDVEILLKCGSIVYVKYQEFLKRRNSFKIKSFVGEDPNLPGNILVQDKETGKKAVFSIQDYSSIDDLFEIVSIIGNKKDPLEVRSYVDNSQGDAQEGDIILHNSELNIDAVFSYNDWVKLSDSWDLVGLYGITTYEEEDADGCYVIMANGHILIIKPEDYSKVSNNWEHVDTISKTNVITYTSNAKLAETTSDKNGGLHTNAFGSATITSHTFENGTGTIVFDRNVELFGENAFLRCVNMTSIIIPNSVTSIGKNAFNSCSDLTSITIPNNVTSIGMYAFNSCSGLKKVIVKDIAAWCGIKFDDSYSNPLYYAKHIYSDEDTEITNLIIPNSVTSIGDYAFLGCSDLTSITIPNSVISIGINAFYYCLGLTSVTIGNGVISIGEKAFSGCTGLTNVTCEPTTPPSMGTNVFSSNASDRKIYVPSASVNAYKAATNWSTYASDIEAISA